MKDVKSKIKNKKGFTIIELLVAISIFVTMILSITEIFAKVNEGQRHAIAAQNIQESMRYAFEVIAKEIRMAKLDEGGACIGAGHLYEENAEGTSLKFLNYHNECVTYYLDGSALAVDRDDYKAYASPGTVVVSNLIFSSVDFGGIVQPRVTIKMEIEAFGKEIDKQKTILQTTISSRYY
jgi:prepilin-type N-terminal cleavage/methylation domain-containing protein